MEGILIPGKCSCGRDVHKLTNSAERTLYPKGLRYFYPERATDGHNIFRCGDCGSTINDSWIANEDAPHYLLFCSDGDYLPPSLADRVCDEIDTRMFLMEGCMLVVNANCSREDVETAIPHMLDILD